MDRESHFKASGTDLWTKVIVIKQNAHKYFISAMCKCLKISRSTYYYKAPSKPDEIELEWKIETIFHNNRYVYGSCKIKKELEKEDLQISRRRIFCIMKRLGLVSSYTIAAFHLHKSKCKESPVKNERNRKFHNQKHHAVFLRSKFSWIWQMSSIGI